MDSTVTVTPNAEPTELVIKSDWLAAKLIENGYKVKRMAPDKFRKNHFVHIFPFSKEILQAKDGLVLEHEDEKDRARAERQNRYSSNQKNWSKVTADELLDKINDIVAEQIKNIQHTNN